MNDGMHAADNHGLLSAADVRLAGLSHPAVVRLVGSGDLTRLAHGWYAVGLPRPASRGAACRPVPPRQAAGAGHRRPRGASRGALPAGVDALPSQLATLQPLEPGGGSETKVLASALDALGLRPPV